MQKILENGTNYRGECCAALQFDFNQKTTQPE
jgi:hypothetical protein